ncbi:MAG: alternative ribosome rescue aminoacyl-tRNA hydrolase ArfB [Actinomycetota bacterium]|nr:alternative ribosome rescue aminoacyl-tRNA hydrolase ArfB [Actinomycetota bacterium]
MGKKSLEGLVIPESECRFRFTPSGGPGGQHANRSNTRVELIWVVAESKILSKMEKEKVIQKFGPVVRVVVDETRSQSRNRDIALARLQAKVVSSLRSPKKRVATKPSRLAKARRVSSKKHRGQLKKMRRSPKIDES